MTGLHLRTISSSTNVEQLNSNLSSDENFDNLYKYLYNGLIYLLIIHFFNLLISKLIKWSFMIYLLIGLLISELIILSSGYTINLTNLPNWYLLISPLKWLFIILLPVLHNDQAMAKFKTCKPKQIQRQDIITQSNCEQPNGFIELYELTYLNKNGHYNNNVNDTQLQNWLLILLLITIGLNIFVFLVIRFKYVKKSLKSLPNKP